MSAQASPATELQNPTLGQVYATLTRHSAQQTEFIPHIFYALHQLKNDNGHTNTFETATSNIRHRLKLCKAAIAGDAHAVEMLSRPCDEWPAVVCQKEQEIEAKKRVHRQLRQRVEEIAGPLDAAAAP
ncbi:AFL182Cp [Eremothecium gossypii ATCC 10895]|uniref:Mediator of RNA polymerase II transcription subunit 9 n=1 Tax=Eremothecium gossypii (strain ATCC 10895 / CBS 109.51 / FGSC 9923 / NRRL Y-1056) TaxID=284811 RepID=MED9_EREGS|nr:AFL182Cp [Eremothecium gossypii ATCC 10895]Q755Q2.1 RecName: Full=Mediator of RNA polymerase II transcription subunit 9; AltName: Full=Mediator complex subunit 9 [Eremothecium gossypii ATCC 10895]AAS53192.1 AFL182Cp [Eremothecium gossypii ATCC 10895]AEY97502.1 FAFL182Cp [Eremothecium gossypii FDAG1]